MIAAQVVALALALRWLGLLLGANARDMSYFHLVGRIDQFVAGMVGAIVLRQRGPRPIPFWAVEDRLATGRGREVDGRDRDLRGAGDRCIGQVSVSVYLFHFAIITACIDNRALFRMTGRPPWDALITTCTLVLPVTLALSALS